MSLEGKWGEGKRSARENPKGERGRAAQRPLKFRERLPLSPGGLSLAPPALSIKFKNIKLRPNKRKSTKININLKFQQTFRLLERGIACNDSNKSALWCDFPAPIMQSTAGTSPL